VKRILALILALLPLNCAPHTFGAVPLRSVVTLQDGSTISTTQPVWNVATIWDDFTVRNMTDGASTRPTTAPVMQLVTKLETGTSFFSLRGSRVVENVGLVAPAGKVGFWVSGKANVVRNVKVMGGEKCVYLANADETLVDGFDLTADCYGYGLYIRDGSDNVVIRNGAIRVAGTGQHAVRIYDAHDLLMENVTLEHRAAYGGSPLNVKSGARQTYRKVKTYGHAPGFGHNPVPEEATYTLTDVLVENCEFQIEQTIGVAVKSGTQNLTFRGTTIRQTTGAECIKVEPNASCTVENVQLFGTRAYPITGNLAAVTFRGTNSYNGQPLGAK
jgi:hypothetical protein